MSVGITFGSIGDIIAVGQIALSLAKALSHSRGSAREYQGLIKELQTFDQALLQVVALWQNYDISPEIESLSRIIKDTSADWRDTLVEFRAKIEKKYGKSLGLSESGHVGAMRWLRDAPQKIAWMTEKEDIVELRTKLQGASSIITMLAISATEKSYRLTNAQHESRVRGVHSLLQRSIALIEEQTSQLKAIDQKSEEQIKTSKLILGKVNSGIVSLMQVKHVMIDIRHLLGLLQTQIKLQQITPRGIGTTWQQAPVIFEDALGNILPIPLDLVDSWEMLDMILLKKFQMLPGREKIMKREYAVEDSVTGKELDRKRDWTLCFRPGQKVDMSMLFDTSQISEVSCPRCKTGVQTPPGLWATCVNPQCRMIFRQVTKMTHRIQSADRLQTTVWKADGTPIRINIPLFPPNFNPTRTSIYAEQVSPSREPEQQDDPADFRRVQLVRQLLEKIVERTINDEEQYATMHLSFSATKHLGKVQIRVLSPTMEKPVVYPGVPLKQYTRLPPHLMSYYDRQKA